MDYKSIDPLIYQKNLMALVSGTRDMDERGGSGWGATVDTRTRRIVDCRIGQCLSPITGMLCARRDELNDRGTSRLREGIYLCEYLCKRRT